MRGGATATALVVAAVAVAFGAGYTASRTVLGEGGVWLSKGRTVTHVNAATGAPDATIEDDLVDDVGAQEIVVSDDRVTVVDTTSGAATTLDTTTMSPGASSDLPEGAGRPGMVAAGALCYLVGMRSVVPVDPVTLQPTASAIEFGRVAGAVATAEGTLVVLDAARGTTVEIADGVPRGPVSVTADAEPDQLALTAVSGRPVVVDTGSAVVRRLRPGGAAEHPVRVDALAGRPVSSVGVADPSADGSTVWMVVKEAGELVGVDLDSGRVRTGVISARGARVQSPVVLAGWVYVPNGESHTVTVVDGESLVEVRDPLEVEGSSGRLEVFVREGRVWINDPAGRMALAVEPDGTVTIIDKGTGQGVDEQVEDVAPPEPQPAEDPGPSPPGVPPPDPGPSPPGAPPPGPDEAVSPPPDPPPPPEADVPDVVGRDQREACRQVEGVQLTCDARPVPDAPRGTARGTVLSQDPTSGRLPLWSPVVVNYYEPDPVAVPDVVGQRVARGGPPQDGPACQAVVSAGFTCSSSSVAAVTDQPADEALVQQPAAPTELVPGETVSFTYSLNAIVPDVVGRNVDDACAGIEQLNLVCQRESVPVGRTVGVVFEQSPPLGTGLAADAVVVVRYPADRPHVPDARSMTQGECEAAFTQQQLVCSWEPNPYEYSIRDPSRSDAQSLASGSEADPGTVVSVFHPAGPDADLVRFRARGPGGPMEQWALAPTAGPGRYVLDELSGRPGDWFADGGNAGRCYQNQLPGSYPLWDFVRASGDPQHEEHFYAVEGTAQYARGVQNYSGAPADRVLCYVLLPNTGAVHVTEWWKGSTSHFFTTSEGAPGAGYQADTGHWTGW